MTRQLITPDLYMDEILDRWPETIMLFLEYRMACVGCSMSSFDTLRDALDAYELPQDTVLEISECKGKRRNAPLNNSALLGEPERHIEMGERVTNNKNRSEERRELSGQEVIQVLRGVVLYGIPRAV